MTSPLITVPQNPVTGGESGHLSDHDHIASGLLALWQCLPEGAINARAYPYSAAGDGVTDDTAAINNAIAAAGATGSTVWLPPGTYLCTPTGSPAVALSVPSNVRIVGAGRNATILKKGGNGTLISMSGPSTDTTGVTHCRFSGIESLGINGNGKTGLVLQLYYADNLLFRDMVITSNSDLAIDSAEFWDSRFEDCAIVSCTGTASSTTQPNMWLRNSAASSGFGNSAGNTNQIHLRNCRFEAFGTGALWIGQGTGNSSNPNGFYITDCKFEADSLQGGPYISTDNTTKNCYFEHIYVFSGGFAPGYSTAQTLISLFGANHALRDAAIGNGATATVVNGVLAHAVGGSTIVLEDIVGGYSTSPTTAHINFDASATGRYTVKNCPTNSGTALGGTLPALNYIPSQKPVAAATSTTTIANSSTLTALQSGTVPAKDPLAGAVYAVEGYGVFSTTGTPTMTFALYWGGTAGTLVASIPAITAPSGVTSAPFRYRAVLTFRSTTSVTAQLDLLLVTNTSTGAASAYTGALSSATTVATSSSSALAVGFTWGTASASNTISLLGGSVSRIG